MSTLPSDVFLNGVPHSVQTSELTKNAINPRNAFIDNGKNELDDISTEFVKPAFDPTKALQIEPESSETKQSESNYPTTKDRFATHEFLSASKTHLTRNDQKLSAEPSSDSEMFYESLHHVEDRIQNLRKKHPSQNIQQIDRHNIQNAQHSLGNVQRLNDNLQPLHQKSFTENRQLVDEKTVEDNFQKLAPTESRRDNILYKEKKNIHDISQQIEAPNSGRSSATLGQGTQNENKSDSIAHPLHAEQQIQTNSASHRLLAEDQLRARVRKVKENIGKLNQSLTDIEEDK